MSAMEKLFAQIFERKDWIVEQVRHQARLFDQHLASTLVIDGIVPPPWLLHSQPSSLIRECQKEDLIRELLQPQPQFSVPCSTGHQPVYDKSVLTADTRGFPADLCTDFCTLQGEASSKLSLSHDIPKDDTTFVLNDASKADPNIGSPQHQTDVTISKDYPDLDQSLARVQRSKARQKALEFRNSAKASGSCLREKNHIIDPSRSAAFGFAPPLSEDVFSAEPVESSHASSHVNSTEETQMVDFKSKEKNSKISSGGEMRTFIAGSCSNGLMEMDAPCSIDLEVQRQSEGERGDSLRKEKESNIWCGEVTKPHKLTESCQMNEALKSDNSSFPVGKNKGMVKLMQPVSWVDSSLELNRSGSMHEPESRDCQIDGHQTTDDSCEIRQLRRSSNQPNCEELPGLEMSSDHGDVKMAGSPGKPAQSPQEDDCGNGNANITEDFLASGCSVSQLVPTHSDQLVTVCTHNLPGAHVTTLNGLSNLSDNVDPERCAADAAQSSVAFEKPPEGSSFGIPSNIDPAYLKNVPEGLAPSLCSDSNILLKPKQLDFNDLRENGSCLNYVPGAVSEESVEATALCKGLLTSREQEKSFEELGSTRNLSENTVDKIGQTSTSLGQDVEIVVSEICGNDKDVISDYPLQGKISKSRVSFIDHSINLSSACTSLPCTLHDGQYSSLSGLKSNRDLTTPHEKVTREFDATESIELDLVHHKLETDSCGGPVMPMELTSFKFSDHQSVKRLLVQSESNGFANSSPQLDKSTELSPASLSLQMNPLHSTNENCGKRKAIRAEDDEKIHISSKKAKVDRSLSNPTQHNAKHDVTETSETLQMQQILKGVTLEVQHEDTGSHLVHESQGQAHSLLPDLSDTASVARIEGIVDEEGQCLTEDIFSRTDEEHLTENREAHNQRKYEFPHHSPDCVSVEQTRKDQMMPVFEGFIMPTNDEKPFSDDGFSFEKLDVQDGITEHASMQKLLSNSASVHTPLSHFSTTYKLHKAPNLYKSVPNGLLEYMDIGNTLSMNGCDGVNSFLNKEVEQGPYGRSHSDCLPLSYAESAGYQKKIYTSPIGKLWNIIASKSGSSKEKRSLNPELPCISEENENVEEVADISKEGVDVDVRTSAANRKPLADITEDPNYLASVSDTENEMTRCSLDSIRTEVSFAGTHRKAKQKPGKQESNKRHRVKRPVEVPNNRFSKPKSSLRKGGPGISEMDSKRDNIVSHVTSFLPLVQQKQTTAPMGKRDIKVRALEAAEAAKRQAEKKEIERKMKKEALKLERARLEKESIRQLELQRKRKEEEQKKKLADIAMKKRQREEEERREKERKRKRVEGARRNQENREDMPTKKEQQGPKYHTEEREELGNELRKNETVETEKRGAFPEKKLESEAELDKGLGSKPCATERICVDGANKAISILQKATDIEGSISDGNQEQSYEISPYKCSDDEDEDEDEDDTTPNDKFVPSWASKSHMARAISSQQTVNPDVIFPPDSFCSIYEVVMPRKFQLK